MGTAPDDEAYAIPHGRRLRESPLVSIVVAAVAALIPFAIANVLFLWAARDLEAWRGPVTEGLLPALCNDPLVLVIWAVIGFFALQTRRVLAPFAIGSIVIMAVAAPVFAGGGPVARMQVQSALFDARLGLLALEGLLNAVLVMDWMRFGPGNASLPKPRWF